MYSLDFVRMAKREHSFGIRVVLTGKVGCCFCWYTLFAGLAIENFSVYDRLSNI
jgi:hypothetical protein